MFPGSLLTPLVPDVCPGAWKNSLYWCLKYLVHPQPHFMDLVSAVIESSCLHCVSCYHLPATHHESWAGSNFPIPLKFSGIKKKKRKSILRLFPRRGRNPKIYTPNSLSLGQSLQMRRFKFKNPSWMSS